MPVHVRNALASCPMCADKAVECTAMAQLKTTQEVAAVRPAQAKIAKSQDNPRLLVGTAECPEGSGGSHPRPGAKQHSDPPAKPARFSSSGTNSSSSSSSSSSSKRKAAAKRRPPPGPRQGARQASASARNLGSQAGRQTEGPQKPAAKSEGKRAASGHSPEESASKRSRPEIEPPVPPALGGGHWWRKMTAQGPSCVIPGELIIMPGDNNCLFTADPRAWACGQGTAGSGYQRMEMPPIFPE